MDEKTYVFGNEGTSMLGLLAPLLQQKGIDPGLLALMKNNNGFGGEGGWFIWIIFLFFLMGWGRNGWGNQTTGSDFPLASFLNNDNGRDLLMSAIQGNGTAISQLATTLNCDVNSIQTAINGVSSMISQVGNQVGLTGQQVQNAILSGDQTLASQMASCCCDVRETVTRMGYENQIANLNQTNQLQTSINSVATGQERGFSSVAYETQAQTCALQNTINDGISKVLAGQSAAELRELQAKISRQGDELSSYKTASIISQQLAPISGALNVLQSEVNAIKSAQPSTLTLPNPAAVAVPSCVAAQYGLGYGLGTYTSLWG